MLLESYGHSLTKEADFREYLTNLADNKLLTLLRALLSEEIYKQKLAAARYDFLRTKEIFKRCMDLAYEKYSWTKRSL